MAEAASEKFHYPPVAEPTGVLQYRRDRGGSATLQSGDKVYGRVLRAEVFKATDKLAAHLVQPGSDFSHVAADTPIGQPAEYKLVAKAAAPAAAKRTLSSRLRASAENESMTAEEKTRLVALADAAEAIEQMSDEERAAPEIEQQLDAIRTESSAITRAATARGQVLASVETRPDELPPAIERTE